MMKDMGIWFAYRIDFLSPIFVSQLPYKTFISTLSPTTANVAVAACLQPWFLQEN